MFLVLTPTSSEGELIALRTSPRRYDAFTVTPRLGLLFTHTFSSRQSSPSSSVYMSEKSESSRLRPRNTSVQVVRYW